MTLRRAACHHPFVVLNPGCPHATVEGKLVPRTTCLNTNKKKKNSRAHWFSLFILNHCCRARLIHTRVIDL